MTRAVLYRWTVKPGMEAQFRAAWLRGTRAIHARCNSFGARLHRAGDGSFVSYALWPDEAARKACFAQNDFSADGFDAMRATVDRYHGEEVLDVLEDALTPPPDTDRADADGGQ